MVIVKYTEIKKYLDSIENPVDKLEFVMDLGKTLETVPEKAECSEILGCSSFVEICQKDGRFYGRADSLMVRGIVAIILALVDGKSVMEIKKMDLETEIKALKLNFGAARLNGIQSMISFFKNL
jgi:cysteine desulfuration protein SufE